MCPPLSLGRGVSCPVVKASSAGGETSSTRFRLWVISGGKGKRIEFPETTVDFSQGDDDGSCVVSLAAQMMQTRNADADEELSACHAVSSTICNVYTAVLLDPFLLYPYMGHGLLLDRVKLPFVSSSRCGPPGSWFVDPRSSILHPPTLHRPSPSTPFLGEPVCDLTGTGTGWAFPRGGTPLWRERMGLVAGWLALLARLHACACFAC